MKHILVVVMAFAACVLLVQCRKPVFPDFDGDGQQTITFTTGGDGSKGDFFQEGEPGDDVYKKLKYKWKTGDVVRVYASVDGTFDDGVYCGLLHLVQSCDGSTTGTFDGSVVMPSGMTGSSKVRFFHLGNGVNVVSNSSACTASVDFGSQTGNLTGENSVSSKIVAKYDADYNSKGKYGGEGTKLSVQYAIIKVNIEKFIGENVTVNNVVNTGININGNGVMSYTPGTSMTLAYKDDDYYAVFVPDEVAGGTKSYIEKTYSLGSIHKVATIRMTVKPDGFYTPNGDGSAAQLEPISKERFTINSYGKQVKFAKGNLYWDGVAFRFEANQWDYRFYNGIQNDVAFINGVNMPTPAGTVGSFFWSFYQSVAYAYDYSDQNDDTFFTNVSGFQVNGQTGWYTLSNEEWSYLLLNRTPKTTSANYRTLTVSGSTSTVTGLVILPDNSSVSLDDITTTADLDTYGAVFLPITGRRYDSQRGWGDNWVAGVYSLGEITNYWSCTPEGNQAWGMFTEKNEGVFVFSKHLSAKFDGSVIRLVRDV